MNTQVSYQLDNGIAIVQINNGKVNALSPEVIQQLGSALDRAEADKAVVILTGQPGILSGGYDLKVMMSGPQNALDLVAQGSALTRRMLAHPYPVIVACSGHAVAKGAFLMLAADYRIAIDGEFKIGLNEVQIGMTMHDAGIILARDRLTPAAFQRSVINAEMFSPEEARVAGFVDRVVPAEQLLESAMAIAEQFKQLNMPAHAKTKLKVRAGLLAALDAAIEHDRVHGLG
ncbi:crotonase/enoyl-CoA hydratase family protein [Thiopseudomonas denitrificans]|uniref:Enoyl-CoA hydratase n=1 Tax=Thiopseudomonas denitrificans TaxID=1501432 RepID=A0A4R6U1V9_9GAMM|nr:crotonase/enoyl-CoA hydratase family protein [Thiopseudomonas denitrificans]TDQ39911.1 enoyl-CoA hydratase [Thiopseudomonas denitrificans]